MNWTTPYHGVTHLKLHDSQAERWATVVSYDGFAVLHRMRAVEGKSHEFRKRSENFDSTTAAKTAGEAWVEREEWMSPDQFILDRITTAAEAEVCIATAQRQVDMMTQKDGDYDSAVVGLTDAKSMFTKKLYGLAAKRALHSLRYSVGIFHEDYKKCILTVASMINKS